MKMDKRVTVLKSNFFLLIVLFLWGCYFIFRKILPLQDKIRG